MLRKKTIISVSVFWKRQSVCCFGQGNQWYPSSRDTTNGRRTISAPCLMVSQRETNLAARLLLGASVKAKMLANTSAGNGGSYSSWDVNWIPWVRSTHPHYCSVGISCFRNVLFRIYRASTQDFDSFRAFKFISGLSPANRPTPRNTGTAAQDAHLGWSDQLENFSAININFGYC